MDWAVFTETIERLDTVSDADFASKLAGLQNTDPTLADAVKRFQTRSANASSFMQTRMPGLPEDASPLLAQGDRVGVWQIDDRLGAGGMGEVYRASRADGLFDQQAALKIAKSKTKAFRERFDAERQRLAQLEHPNIARIIDGGTSDNGAPYMTMEFVDGQPIDTYAKENRLGRAQRLALIGSLCSALSHAHGRLVLHRDIKHDNVLINADGEVRLIDFGVASLLDDASAQASRGPLTIAYAAPEQLEGEAVSAATDIFAVGMLAHLLETGSLPERQSDGGVGIDADRIGDADLSAILAKATAKKPQDRYASADALGDDLAKYLGGFPVAARPVSSVVRLKKLVARNTLTSAMSAAALAAVVAGIIGVSVFAVEAKVEAEAQLVAQLQGTALTELYETSAKGFGSFVASLDPESEQGEAIFVAMRELEQSADEMVAADPRKAAEVYIFLSDFYANAGMVTQSGLVAQKLADPAIPQSFPTANILLNAALFASDPNDVERSLKWLDISSQFFASNDRVYNYEIVMANCIRSRVTSVQTDQRTCLESASKYLATYDPVVPAQIASARTIQAYSIDEATRLGELDLAEKIAREALATYDGNDNITAVPEAAFWIHLARLSLSKDSTEGARSSFLSASHSIAEKPEFEFYEVVIATELANLENREGNFDSALAHAERGRALAQEIYGPQSVRASNAEIELAKALAGLERYSEAIRHLSVSIDFERSSGSSGERIAELDELLEAWSQDVE